MPKIKVNKEVRTLLVELDKAFQQFNWIVEQLGAGVYNDPAIGDLGAEKIHAEHLILGISYRIHKASTGVKDQC